MGWLVEQFLPAAALTYVVVGSAPLAPVRAALLIFYPRSWGALVNCAPCTGFWAGLGVGGVRLACGYCDTFHFVTGALACTGALWILAAITGVLEKLAESVAGRTTEVHPPMFAPSRTCPECGWIEHRTGEKSCRMCGNEFEPETDEKGDGT